MPIVRIADAADAVLDPYRALKRTNETVRRGLFIAEGEKLVRRLLESGLEVDSVLLSEPYVEQFAGVLPAELPVFVIADEAVAGLVGFNFHRGILACGRRPSPRSLEEVCGSADKGTTIVVCPDVQDPENLGTIVRLCRALGVAGLVLGPGTADPFSRRVQRVSMGNVYTLPMARVDDAIAAAASLRSDFAVETWATVLADDAETLGERTRPARLALVLGSEGHGLSAEMIRACDRRVTIPMRAGVDSLNVAVAAGIFLYELTQGSRPPEPRLDPTTREIDDRLKG